MGICIYVNIQCVGRVIRSKTDYGLVVLADARYNMYHIYTVYLSMHILLYVSFTAHLCSTPALYNPIVYTCLSPYVSTYMYTPAYSSVPIYQPIYRVYILLVCTI